MTISSAPRLFNLYQLIRAFWLSNLKTLSFGFLSCGYGVAPLTSIIAGPSTNRASGISANLSIPADVPIGFYSLCLKTSILKSEPFESYAFEFRSRGWRPKEYRAFKDYVPTWWASSALGYIHRSAGTASH